MRRLPQLQGLSSEHHANLVLARQLRQAAQSGDAALGWAAAQQLTQRFEAEIEPHFQAEEAHLFPALAQHAQAAAGVQTALAQHTQLRQLARAAATGQAPHLLAFADALQAHVRQEERELFELAQQLLSPAQLDAIGQHAPKAPRQPTPN